MLNIIIETDFNKLSSAKIGSDQISYGCSYGLVVGWIKFGLRWV